MTEARWQLVAEIAPATVFSMGEHEDTRAREDLVSESFGLFVSVAVTNSAQPICSPPRMPRRRRSPRVFSRGSFCRRIVGAPFRPCRGRRLPLRGGKTYCPGP